MTMQRLPMMFLLYFMAFIVCEGAAVAQVTAGHGWAGVAFGTIGVLIIVRAMTFLG